MSPRPGARRRPSPAPPPRFSRGTIAVLITAGVCLTLAAVLVGISGWIGMRHHERAMPNVSLAGVDVAGQTRIQMKALLEETLVAVPCEQLELSVGEATYVVAADEIGRGWDIDAALDAAMRANRGPDGNSDMIEQFTSLFSKRNVGVQMLAYDPALLATQAEQIALEHELAPVNAAARVDTGAFTVVPATDGRRVDAAAVRTAISGHFDAGRANCRLELDDEPLPAAITSAEAELAVRQASAMSVELALIDGEEIWKIDAETLRPALSFAHNASEGTVSVTIDDDVISAAVTAHAESVARAAAEASFTLGARGVTGVKPGAVGRQLDVAATTAAVLVALTERQQGTERPSVQIVAVRSEPTLSTELATATFERLTLIGSWTTEFTPDDGNGFGANIHIGADDADGYVIMPGERLDFWDAIGPVTEERGYSYGGVIIDGRSVAGGAIGGGICSTSTTLFNAALRAGLQIDSRAAHAYFIDRYPVGLDATVWATESAEQSMIFTNDTAHPIIVRGYTDDANSVTFELWGVPDGRSVTLSEPVVSDRSTATTVYEDSTELAPGTTKQVEFPHDGFRSVVTRTVTAGDGSALHSDTFTSHYRTVNGVILRGVAAGG